MGRVAWELWYMDACLPESRERIVELARFYI